MEKIIDQTLTKIFNKLKLIYGPLAKKIIINKNWQTIITEDWKTVLENLQFKNKKEETIYNIIKEETNKLEKQTGDWTTTFNILLYNLWKKYLKLKSIKKQTINIFNLNKEWQKIKKLFKDFLDKITKDITKENLFLIIKNIIQDDDLALVFSNLYDFKTYFYLDIEEAKENKIEFLEYNNSILIKNEIYLWIKQTNGKALIKIYNKELFNLNDIKDILFNLEQDKDKIVFIFAKDFGPEIIQKTLDLIQNQQYKIFLAKLPITWTNEFILDFMYFAWNKELNYEITKDYIILENIFNKTQKEEYWKQQEQQNNNFLEKRKEIFNWNKSIKIKIKWSKNYIDFWFFKLEDLIKVLKNIKNGYIVSSAIVLIYFWWFLKEYIDKNKIDNILWLAIQSWISGPEKQLLYNSGFNIEEKIKELYNCYKKWQLNYWINLFNWNIENFEKVALDSRYTIENIFNKIIDTFIFLISLEDILIYNSNNK